MDLTDRLARTATLGLIDIMTRRAALGLTLDLARIRHLVLKLYLACIFPMVFNVPEIRRPFLVLTPAHDSYGFDLRSLFHLFFYCFEIIRRNDPRMSSDYFYVWFGYWFPVQCSCDYPEMRRK